MTNPELDALRGDSVGVIMADNKVVLRNFYRSSASWRVRIDLFYIQSVVRLYKHLYNHSSIDCIDVETNALAIKGVKYEYLAVDLFKDGGQQHTGEYKRLNPMGQVPTLYIDGHYLIQSLPIIEYLEERFPVPALLPKDPFGRAQVRALAEVINSGIQPFQNNTTLNMVGEKSNEWAKHHIEYGFKALESLLEKTAGVYSYGDSVTIADLFLVPQVFGANRFKADMSQFPIINRVHAALVELPAFQAAHAYRQPDTPAELRVD